MTFEEAKKLLGDCDRHECRDHYFRDREISWTFEIDGEQLDIADAYVGAGTMAVWIKDPTVDMERVEFTGEAARDLAKCGRLANITRNDSCGPDEYMGW